MTKNEGKKFEEDFKKSVPSNAFIYKLKDAGGWSNASNTRFTVNNICDYIMYADKTLYLLELKSLKGKSLPYSNVKENQIKGLTDATKYKGVISGLVVNFRDVNKTYFLPINRLNHFKKTSDRKSYPIDLFEKDGILIKQKIKTTRYDYFIDDFIKNTNIENSDK